MRTLICNNGDRYDHAIKYIIKNQIRERELNHRNTYVIFSKREVCITNILKMFVLTSFVSIIPFPLPILPTAQIPELGQFED